MLPWEGSNPLRQPKLNGPHAYPVPQVPGVDQGVWRLCVARNPPDTPWYDGPIPDSGEDWEAARRIPSTTMTWDADTIDKCRRPIMLLLAGKLERLREQGR